MNRIIQTFFYLYYFLLNCEEFRKMTVFEEKRDIWLLLSLFKKNHAMIWC